MFRVSLYCEDKKLPAVLHSLIGLALDLPEVVPVANAEHKNGKVRAANGDLSEMFAKYAKAHKLTKFVGTDLAEFCKEAHFAPGSRVYLIQRLVKAGAIKKHGKGAKTHYTVAS